LNVDDLGWKTVPVKLPPGEHLKKQPLIEAIKAQDTIKGYIDKADQLAFLQRCENGNTIDVGCLRVGNSRVLALPGELFVEYQLAAKAMQPELNIAMAAYGDYGPGYIGTEMVRAVPEEVLNKSILPHIPVNRLGEPEEIARCVVFLASDESGFITGSTISANGGQYMV